MRYFLWCDSPELGDVRTVMNLEGYDSPPSHTILWAGRSIRRGEFPVGKLLLARNGADGDSVLNPLSWPIISERYKSIINTLIKDDVQYFPAPLWDAVTGRPVNKYYVINILNRLDCVDMDKSVYSYFPDTDIIQSFDVWYLKKALISGLNIFRVKEGVSHVFVSEAFVRLSERTNITGVSFKEVSVSD